MIIEPKLKLRLDQKHAKPLLFKRTDHIFRGIISWETGSVHYIWSAYQSTLFLKISAYAFQSVCPPYLIEQLRLLQLTRLGQIID